MQIDCKRPVHALGTFREEESAKKTIGGNRCKLPSSSAGSITSPLYLVGELCRRDYRTPSDIANRLLPEVEAVCRREMTHGIFTNDTPSVRAHLLNARRIAAGSDFGGQDACLGSCRGVPTCVYAQPCIPRGSLRMGGRGASRRRRRRRKRRRRRRQRRRRRTATDLSLPSDEYKRIRAAAQVPQRRRHLDP